MNCRHCQVEVENLQEMVQHTRVKHSDVLCDVCDNGDIGDAETLEQHYMRMHFVEDMGIRCRICQQFAVDFICYLVHISLCAHVSELILHQLHIYTNFDFIKSLSLSLFHS